MCVEERNHSLGAGKSVTTALTSAPGRYSSQKCCTCVSQASAPVSTTQEQKADKLKDRCFYKWLISSESWCDERFKGKGRGKRKRHDMGTSLTICWFGRKAALPCFGVKQGIWTWPRSGNRTGFILSGTKVLISRGDRLLNAEGELTLSDTAKTTYRCGEVNV